MDSPRRHALPLAGEALIWGGVDQASPTGLKQIVRAEARAAGFAAARVTAPSAIGAEQAERLAHFLREGRHGDMDWMATTAERRGHPLALWPEARSIVMLGMSYAPEERSAGGAGGALPRRRLLLCPEQGLPRRRQGRPQARRRRRWQRASGADVKVFVDTAPLMEKPLAQPAGLGWQGKHTNLVSREHGSWLFLGAILTTAAIEPDAPEPDHCGSCRRCLDVCPTDAFPAPYQLDRAPLHRLPHHRAQGPHRRRVPQAHRQPRVRLRRLPRRMPLEQVRRRRARDPAAGARGAAIPPLAELLALDDAAFRARFAGTPVKRTGRDRVVRNALIAAGNSGDASLLPAVERLLADASPLVRAMAVWALRQLARHRGLGRRAKRYADREIRFGRAGGVGNRPLRLPGRLADAALLLRIRLFGRGAGPQAEPAPRRVLAGTRTNPARPRRQEAGARWRLQGRRPSAAVRSLLAGTTHLLVSIPPDLEGDAVLRDFAADIAALPDLAWIGYLSTVGVYGDAKGAWVDEASPVRPLTERSLRRAEAERAWLDFGARSRPPGGGVPPRRHLRARPQRPRQPQGRHGAAHRQAGPGVQPHPRGRHRPRAGRRHRQGHGASGSSTSATTSRRRPRTWWPMPPS